LLDEVRAVEPHRGIEPEDLLITRRPDHAHYGGYQRQQLPLSHLWVHQRQQSTGVRTTFDTTPELDNITGGVLQGVAVARGQPRVIGIERHTA
jgi:hypothetical protein